MAKGIIDNFECDICLTRNFLKHILNKDLYISDLEDYDPELCRNLTWMLNNEITGLEQYFTYTKTYFGNVIEIELVKDGKEKLVTEENKKEYVKLVANYIMTLEI